MERAFSFGSFAIARRQSAVSFLHEGIRRYYRRTFPGLNNGNSIVYLDVAVRLITSCQREEILSCTARTFLEGNGEVDEIELLMLAMISQIE